MATASLGGEAGDSGATRYGAVGVWMWMVWSGPRGAQSRDAGAQVQAEEDGVVLAGSGRPYRDGAY